MVKKIVKLVCSQGIAVLVAVLLPSALAAVDLVSGIGDPTLLSASANGPSERLTSFAVDASGRRVAFASQAANLAPGDANKVNDVFVRDLLLGTTVCVSTDSGGTVGNGESSNPAISRDGRYVAFDSFADNLVAGDTNDRSDIFVKDLQTGVTLRVSTGSSGEEADGSSVKPAISADGRFVAFESYAENLAGPNHGAAYDIYVKDLQTGTTTRVSNDSSGALANSNSYGPAISADGRHVVFKSAATNLVDGDTNGTWDIYVKDLQTRVTIRVSTDSAGVEADARSDDPTISSNGRYVSFSGYATNLVTGDTNGKCDVFVKDLQTGATTRASTDGSGAEADSFSYNKGISDDGLYVVFETAATNLIAGDPGSGIIRKDLQSGATERVNADDGGARVSGSDDPAISGDGRFVAFRSSSAALVADDGNGVRDIFRKDLQTGSVALVSVRDPAVTGFFSASGYSGAGYSPASADGRFVAFRSEAPNLVHGDTNGCYDAFVRDLQTGTTVRASTDSAGAQANNSSGTPHLSADGRYLVFDSSAPNLVPGDTNIFSDVFLKDLQTGATTLVSTDSSGAQGKSGSYNPILSADARKVVFRSYAGTLDGGTHDGLAHIFVKDLPTNEVLRASADAGGTPANDGSGSPTISADGRFVAYESWATNLVPGDTNGYGDVFVKDLQTGMVIRASTDSAGAEGDRSSGSPALSADGRFVAFWSKAGNLVPGGTAGEVAAYVKDLQTGITSLAGPIGDGARSSGYSSGPAISGNGRYVVFISSYSDLVAEDTNDRADVFIKDLRSGNLSRVNLGSAGEEANWNSGNPAISLEGQHVTFTSSAYNLVVGDGNQSPDVYRIFVPHPQADLQISVTGPAQVVAGTDLAYTVELVNDGPETSETVVVTSAVPAGCTFVSAALISGAGWEISAPAPGAAGTVLFSKSAAAPGEVSAFSIVVRVEPGADEGSTVACTAEATAHTDDPSGGNSGTWDAEVITRADLEAVKTAPATAVAGGSLIYTITAANTGPSDARDVSLEDLLPAETSFVSQLQTAGPAFTLGVSGNQLTNTIQTLAGGDSAVFEVSVSLDGDLVEDTNVDNTASVAGSTEDPAPGNNQSTAAVLVQRLADLAVSATAPPEVEVGISLTYAVTLSNAGPHVANDVSLTATMPPGTTFVSQIQTAGPAFTLGSSSASIYNTIDILAAGAVASFEVTVSVDAGLSDGDTLHAEFLADAATLDPDLYDNASTAETVTNTPVELQLVIHPPGYGAVDGGGIACPGTCSVTLPHARSTVLLTAAPEPGHSFLRWEGNTSGTASIIDLTMDRNRTVTAVFARNRTVCASGCDYDRVQDAVDGVARDDLILLSPGVWRVNLKVTGEKEFVLRGTGATPAETVLNGDTNPPHPRGDGSVVDLTAADGTATRIDIENLTLRSGAAACGGGLHIEATGTADLAVGLDRVLVRGNRAGGGICARSLDGGTIALDLVNSIVSNNRAAAGGGISATADGAGSTVDLALTNDTVSCNRAKVGGGAHLAARNDGRLSVAVVNAILAGGIARRGRDLYLVEETGGAAVVDASFSDIRAMRIAAGTYTPGPGMRSDTPVFRNPAKGNFHLNSDSPCVDSGTGSGAPGTDYEGGARPQGAGFDMGADEYTPVSYPRLKLLSLTGGERIKGGRPYDITWGAPSSFRKFKVYVSADGGATWTFKAGRRGSVRHYTWKTPRSDRSVATYRIKVVGFKRRKVPASTAMSKRNFTVLK